MLHIRLARTECRNVSGIIGGVLAGSLVASLLAMAPNAAAAPVLSPAAQPASGDRAAAVTQIPPGSGSHGYPYDAVPATPSFAGAPTINLASYGYAEREFKMSGTTNIYRQNGVWGRNGRWGVSVAQSNVPYTTRLLVRYPTNPGEVQRDRHRGVAERHHRRRPGSGVVGDLQRGPLAGLRLRRRDRADGRDERAQDLGLQRYGALGDSNDGQSYDIFTQAAQVARADSATLLGGLSPARVIGMGDSQSAFRLDTYVNAIQPVSHAFNGFLAIGRSVFAAPIGSGLVALSPLPGLIRTDNTTPFIQLNTEGDIEELGAALARQPDNDYLRTWELAGAAHIDLHEGLYEGATIERENPTADRSGLPVRRAL